MPSSPREPPHVSQHNRHNPPRRNTNKEHTITSHRPSRAGSATRAGSDTHMVAEVDSAHAWLILAACWLAAGMTAFCYVNGLYNVALLAEFGQSHALTSACLALLIGLSNITG